MCLFSLDCWVSIEHKVAWAEAYLHTKWYLSPSSRSATTDIGRNWGLSPLGERQLGPHLPQCRVGRGRGLPPYQVASWSMQPFGHIRRGPNRFTNGRPKMVTCSRQPTLFQHAPCPEKKMPLYFASNFAKCQPIFKLLSPVGLAVNFR